MYVAAPALEILCIISAEIGQNMGFFLFGYQKIEGISLGFILGYTFTGFSTFASILGRYNFDNVIDGCCSVLDCKDRRFIPILLSSFRNFTIGIIRMPYLHKQPYAKQIIRSSVYNGCFRELLHTKCRDCGFAFYRHSLWLSIPLALLAGALAITAVESYKKTNSKCSNTKQVRVRKIN